MKVNFFIYIIICNFNDANKCEFCMGRYSIVAGLLERNDHARLALTKQYLHAKYCTTYNYAVLTLLYQNGII